MQQQTLNSQNISARREKATAAQLTRYIDEPIEPWIPYDLRALLNAVDRVEKRMVAVMEAARMKTKDS